MSPALVLSLSKDIFRALEEILQPAFVKTSAGTSSRQVFTAELLSKHQDERTRTTFNYRKVIYAKKNIIGFIIFFLRLTMHPFH
jgi:hypothetical protein